jgi:predicted nucleotidyltransferase
MLHRAEQALGRLVEAARRDASVLAVVVYGSAARGEDTEQSDLDVCLILMPERPVRRTAEASEKRLEYLASFDLDVQIFQQLPLYVRSRILREGQVKFTSDEDALYELALRTVQEFEDFKPVYHLYLEHVAHDGP